jgi:thymidylate synthase (FAD)
VIAHEPIHVLDHGFVKLIDMMGNDARIVEAARNSIAGEGVRAVSEDRGLIRYLIRNKHTTPLESVVFQFQLKMPIFVCRQHIRHRMSSTSEMSGRYGVLPEEFYVPDVEHIQLQAEQNKQGRSTKLVDRDVAISIRSAMRADAMMEFKHYQNYLGGGRDEHGIGNPEITYLRDNGGLARELARINLPLSTYTLLYWKIDLHNLFHYLKLRLDSHAQYEIRVYGEAMAQIAKQVCPIAFEAFEDFILNAVTLSAQEVALLGKLLKASRSSWENIELHDGEVNFKTKRERDEWLAKIEKLVDK